MEAGSPWSINSEQFSYMYAFFHELLPEGELLCGSRAREFFLLSNLPIHQLNHIWTLSDIDRDGQLNPVEFAVALHLTQCSLSGHPPPSSLPDELKVLFVSVLRHTLPVAKPHQLEKCRSAFTSFMENDKYGRTCLSSTAAEYLLTNSKLSRGHLFHIWMLSDLDADGKLSFTEFAVAMQLIFVAKLSHWLPMNINPADILPEEFFSLARQVDAQAADLPPTNHPPPPLVPDFVQVGEDNPVINKVFKTIPSEQFLHGKFEHFTGNPFQSSPLVGNGHLPQLYQEDASPKSDRSSNTSSVRSLVEEREEPMLQQVESVAVVGSREVTPMPGEIKDELEQLSEASQKFLRETGGPDESHTQEPTEVEQRFVVDTDMQSASSKGLSGIIRDISPVPDHPQNGNEDADASQNENKPTATTEQVRIQATAAAQPENEALGNGNQSTADDILAQLADLEAEVMDMLDDTNSYEPPTATPTPAPVTSAPQPTPPSPQKKEEERKKSATVDEPDTGKNIPSSPSSKASPSVSSSSTSSLPRRRVSSESSPEIKKTSISESPRRKRSNTTNKRKSQLLEDIDALLGSELADIESMEEAFKSTEERRKERERKEIEELRQMELRAKETANEPAPQIASIETMRQKRLEESKQIEQAWEEELRAATKIARDSYEQQMSKVQLVENETIQSLEEEFATLLAHERESMKGAREIRAQRQKEEEERLERMRREMQEKKEVSIEEWITMMEQNKLKEMTPEELEKYEARKKAWLERRRQKEELRRAEEEEKQRIARERMDSEYRSYCRAEREVKESRLTVDQLRQLTEEQQLREAEERKMRTEQARRRNMEIKQRELEESKPKAKSALAAKWEASVKGRNSKDVGKTVLSGSPIRSITVSDREKERLAKHIGSK